MLEKEGVKGYSKFINKKDGDGQHFGHNGVFSHL